MSEDVLSLTVFTSFITKFLQAVGKEVSCEQIRDIPRYQRIVRPTGGVRAPRQQNKDKTMKQLLEDFLTGYTKNVPAYTSANYKELVFLDVMGAASYKRNNYWLDKAVTSISKYDHLVNIDELKKQMVPQARKTKASDVTSAMDEPANNGNSRFIWVQTDQGTQERAHKRARTGEPNQTERVGECWEHTPCPADDVDDVPEMPDSEDDDGKMDFGCISDEDSDNEEMQVVKDLIDHVYKISGEPELEQGDPPTNAYFMAVFESEGVF